METLAARFAFRAFWLAGRWSRPRPYEGMHERLPAASRQSRGGKPLRGCDAACRCHVPGEADQVLLKSRAGRGVHGSMSMFSLLHFGFGRRYSSRYAASGGGSLHRCGAAGIGCHPEWRRWRSAGLGRRMCIVAAVAMRWIGVVAYCRSAVVDGSRSGR